MDVIDSEAKAYLLGWIASDGSIRNNQIVICIRACDVGILEALRDFICPDLPIADDCKGSMKRLLICSTQWCKSIQKHLNLSFKKGGSHKKSHLVQMPVDISDSLKWCFLRGLFDGDGSIGIQQRAVGNSDAQGPNTSSSNRDYLRISISSGSLGMRMQIVTLCRALNMNIYMYPNRIRLNGQYAARFLEKIYAKCDREFVLKRKYDIYKQLKVELLRFWDRAAETEEAYKSIQKHTKAYNNIMQADVPKRLMNTMSRNTVHNIANNFSELKINSGLMRSNKGASFQQAEQKPAQEAHNLHNDNAEDFLSAFYVKGGMIPFKQVKNNPEWKKEYEVDMVIKRVHICKSCKGKAHKGCCSYYSPENRSKITMVMGWSAQ